MEQPYSLRQTVCRGEQKVRTTLWPLASPVRWRLLRTGGQAYPPRHAKKLLVARFGGLALQRQKGAVINDRPLQVYNSLRSELCSGGWRNNANSAGLRGPAQCSTSASVLICSDPVRKRSLYG
jgi:hypothetical protein